MQSPIGSKQAQPASSRFFLNDLTLPFEALLEFGRCKSSYLSLAFWTYACQVGWLVNLQRCGAIQVLYHLFLDLAARHFHYAPGGRTPRSLLCLIIILSHFWLFQLSLGHCFTHSATKFDRKVLFSSMSEMIAESTWLPAFGAELHRAVDSFPLLGVPSLFRLIAMPASSPSPAPSGSNDSVVPSHKAETMEPSLGKRFKALQKPRDPEPDLCVRSLAN